MRLIPVNFGFSDRTILEADGRVALQLSPIAFAESPLEMMKITYAVSHGDDLNSSDLSDDLERLIRRHSSPSVQEAVRVARALSTL